MLAHTMGDRGMLLVLVMDCCWLVGVAYKRRREEYVHAVNGRVGRNRQKKKKFVGSVFFLRTARIKEQRGKGVGISLG